MVEYYKGTSVKYPDLFYEVSEGINYYLKEYNIEHTKAEMVFLRKNVLGRLNSEEITQENYDQLNGQFWIKSGIIINEIDNFYKSKIAEDIRKKFF
jgi:hypothetical protein